MATDVGSSDVTMLLTKPRVRHRHLITIDRIVVVLTPVTLPNPVCHDLVPVQGVVLPLLGGAALNAAEDAAVEVLR